MLINSMGDEHCRPAYREKVAAYIRDHSADLCEECNRRADTNPLRAFDCKNPACKEIMGDAPLLRDELCDECRDALRGGQERARPLGIPYVEDPSLVRGLDYYTRTVFEVQADAGLGSQNAIGGGGRYDRLMEEYGGPPTPGLGFALGFERTLLAMEAAGAAVDSPPRAEVYVARVDDDAAAAGVRPRVDAARRGYRRRVRPPGAQPEVAVQAGRPARRAVRSSFVGPESSPSDGVFEVKHMGESSQADVPGVASSPAALAQFATGAVDDDRLARLLTERFGL